MKDYFKGSNESHEEDKKRVDESRAKGQIDWDALVWKPKKGENKIRIFPSRKDSGSKVTFHLKAGKHFIQHDDRKEAFICNMVTHQKPCPACEMNAKLFLEGRKDEAARYRVQEFGAFNVIDRNDEEAGVRIWECPPVAVWEFIIGVVTGGGDFDDVINTKEDFTKGRDVVVMFDPTAPPQNKYHILFKELSPIGTDEQIEKWMGESFRDLIAIKIYPETDYEVAKIKTFGTAVEREQLRKQLREKSQTTPPVEEKKEDKEMAELKKKLAEAEAKLKKEAEEKEDAEAKLKKEEPKVEEKKESPDDIRKKVDAIRKKHEG